MSEESSHQSNDIQNNPIDPKKMECIIKSGIQAPSGDNAQPWQFSYDTDTINLYLDESKDRSFFNISQIASMISCGAVLENMKIAATKFKLVSDIRYGSGKGSVKKVAALVLSMDENIRQDPLAEFIWKRQTNRKLYKRTPAPSTLLKSLKMSINDIPGTEVVFITDPERLKKIARLVSRADIIRIQRKDLHEHFFQMIRFSKKEALNKKDGFYIKNLEAGILGELFLKATRSWPAMSMANKLGFGKMVSRVGYHGILNSSGVALVLTNGQTDRYFLDGGRAVERIWLGMTQKGFCVQPMTAITLFFLRRQLEGGMLFSHQHSRLLDEIWPAYQGVFSDVDLNKNSQVMLFRFGKALPIQQGTLRKHLCDFHWTDENIFCQEKGEQPICD